MGQFSKLNDTTFKGLIKNVPLISIDLIVYNEKNEILLGYRNNAPAKNFWFVPGGRIMKDEKLDDAFKRITLSELNIEIERKDATFLNIFEHHYKNDNFFEIEGVNTHYIVIAYEIHNFTNTKLVENDQHSHFRWAKIDDLLLDEEVHINTKDFINKPFKYTR